jgi:hypothetical protein
MFCDVEENTTRKKVGRRWSAAKSLQGIAMLRRREVEEEEEEEDRKRNEEATSS